MHSEDEETHLSMASMLAKAGVNPWNWIDPSTQATELRNPESEIEHASREDDDDDDDDDDFAVDIGVLSMERQLSTECASYPAVNQTGELSTWDFQDVVYHCYSDSPYLEDCPDEYSVPLKCWNTSFITDLSYAFASLYYFNDDISSWDTGKVMKMEGTFRGASSFNVDISSWDTGSVKDFYFTFRAASSFNVDISSWDTGKITDMVGTFLGASSFNVDISSWDTGKVTSMYGTFFRASSFNVDISSWNTSNVLEMELIFALATEFNQCLGSWASKTPSNVDTYSMLYNTACPNQSDPDPNKGPWCQGLEERCFADCRDAEEFRFGKNDRKSCDSINDITAPTEKKLKKKIRRFCKRKAFLHEEEEATGKKTIRVKDVCQESCGSRGFGPGKRCVNVSS